MALKPPVWVAIDVSIAWNPSVRALGRALKTDMPDGWIVRIVCWLKQHAPDGNVSAYSDDIADAIRWPFPVDLAQALADARLLDDRGVLIGWEELNGWLMQKRLLDAKRQAEKRAREKREREQREEARRVRKAESDQVGRSVGGSVGGSVGATDDPEGVRGPSTDEPRTPRTRSHSGAQASKRERRTA